MLSLIPNMISHLCGGLHFKENISSFIDSRNISVSFKELCYYVEEIMIAIIVGFETTLQLYCEVARSTYAHKMCFAHKDILKKILSAC